MVQVDVFWAYSLGATMAAASAHLVINKAKPFESSYFVKTLLFLALVWSPTGMFLLLRHPSWETMQAAESITHIPPWIVLAFGITNVTQGILGYYVGYKLIEKGKLYLAQVNWLIGYFGLFFILIYGWDGLGYDRFVYDRDMLAGSPAWTPHVGMTDGFLSGVVNFVTSGVFITLMIDGVFLLPIMGLLAWPWLKASAAARNVDIMGMMKAIAMYALAVFVIAGGTALLCSAIVYGVAQLLNVGDVVWHGWAYAPENVSRHIMSYFIGIPVGLAIAWFGFIKDGRLLSPVMREFALVSK